MSGARLVTARLHAYRRRRGSAYVLVLMTTVIVTLIGLSALTLSRIERRRAQGQFDAVNAQSAARAAIEYGYLKIASETNWSNLGTSNPAWATDIPFKNGKFTLTRIAYDNTDPINDRLTLLGIGMYGDAVYRLQIEIVGGRWVDGEVCKQVVN